ncbi:hypothetical protein BpHYR1_013664 [Brachionus plicatilis]|uniref:Uncharacterized protein n=1 Tax=Brachionus plicatilis TaxID=10195 RepID=A0A3M7SXH4_BRAPC|nr:hypothetical protein BpHYR1_013664 [Brachionus plicatilis]
MSLRFNGKFNVNKDKLYLTNGFRENRIAIYEIQQKFFIDSSKTLRLLLIKSLNSILLNKFYHLSFIY